MELDWFLAVHVALVLGSLDYQEKRRSEIGGTAMGGQRPHLAVGDPSAVEILDSKIHAKVRDEFAWRRLVHGAAAARRRHQQVRSSADLGFYHGLLTGYAVALKALEGKVGQGRR